MANSRSVSVRLSKKQLNLIDDHVSKSGPDNRSRFMARCARKQARLILKGKTPLYLPYDLEDDSPVTTITVSLDSDDELLIEAACNRINNKTSPFIVQAAVAALLPKE